MPFKLNQDRRHHIPKQKHKVANWAEYDAALRQRGSLTGHCHTKVDGSGQRAVGQEHAAHLLCTPSVPG
jgi:hypothetical protein